MKTFLMVFFICWAVGCRGQLKAAGGETIQPGDTLTIGFASNPQGFDFITQGGVRMHPSHAGKKLIVSGFKTFGKKLQARTYVQVKGFGLVPVYIDYDNAVAVGELKRKKN